MAQPKEIRKEITAAWVENVVIQRDARGRDLLVLVGGGQAMVTDLGAVNTKGVAFRQSLLQALSEGRTTAQPVNVNVTVDMAGMRKIGNQRGSVTVKRDEAGRIVGMDSTAAIVTDTVKRGE